MLQKTFKRILIVNPYGIGDVLFTTPLVSNLRKSMPESYIAFLVGSRTKDILVNNRDLDEIFVFDKGRFDRLPKYKAIKMLFELIKRIRNKRFDLLIDLSNSSQYGFFEKFFLNIPQRVGFDYKNRGRFLTDRIELKGYKDKHVVEYYLDLIRYLNIKIDDRSLKFPIKEAQLRWAERFLRERGFNASDLIIGVVPGGGSSWGKDAVFKHWHKDKFARLSERLIEENKAKIIIMGDEDDMDICEYILNKIGNNIITTCGKTQLGQFAALCRLCRLIICNDGGALHIAVSQNTPTVSIFGPVDDKVYGPYPPNKANYVLKKDLDCRPCYQDFKYKPCHNRRCLEEIEVDEVLDKVKRLLKDRV